MFATGEDWKTIIWKNKEINVENKPVYYKHYVNTKVICSQDLLFRACLHGGGGPQVGEVTRLGGVKT